MAQHHPQSWLRSTREVWCGYLLTAIAAIPASAIGLFLVSRGSGQQAAILISISLAVLGGFGAEVIIRFLPRGQTRLVVAMPGFVLVVIGGPVRPKTVALSSEPTTSASASLLLRAA
jgi:hypothetical protein